MRRFKDTFVGRDYRFSLGVEEGAGGYYLSTPVSGIDRAVEWEAYFAISEEQYAEFLADPAATGEFTEACRTGGNNHLLLYPR
ncbi:hypothetical protein ASD64_08350 [Mesorhizobium sp. Root157]|uniref:hypothetical protein n=1 Tax=Mesorhizobium sp. Root157 TaxID=1736477 RepID=UPI000700DB94|nr:hypothetical protein [Mesorhizobium sp. Root157]KQZ82935.1 hypothetical protein ASD64_08350 [Mesorhizobium sp. Root157]